MERKDGGPAFPLQEIPGVSTGADGMSLRDYFAAAALQGLVAYPHFKPSHRKPDGSFCFENAAGDYAATAYALADAMLKARSTRDREGG